MTRTPAQLIGEVGGEGFQTMVTGQKVRWVLDLMRGTEFAGRQIHAYEVDAASRAPTISTTSCCTRRAAATTASTWPS